VRVDNLFDHSHAGSVIVNEANGRFFETGAPRHALLALRWVHAL
jgi:iron complex outermembrane recepter protein